MKKNNDLRLSAILFIAVIVLAGIFESVVNLLIK